jgi:hypothetical protein
VGGVRKRAVRFFWATLTLASGVSAAGNIAHAVLAHPGHARIAATAAVIPPAVLLAATHDVALLVRARTYRSDLLVCADNDLGARLLYVCAQLRCVARTGFDLGRFIVCNGLDVAADHRLEYRPNHARAAGAVWCTTVRRSRAQRSIGAQRYAAARPRCAGASTGLDRCGRVG